MASKASLKARLWTRDDYLISTDSSLIPIDELNEALESDRMYWAKSMPSDVLRETLENSLCFGLYQQHQNPSILKFIGVARCITDFTTFVYLTDVWVDPECSGKGLGKWLINCVQSVIDGMPHLRRSMLFTSDWKRSVPFYRELMGMELITLPKEGEETGVAIMQHKGPALG